jgi:5-methylcytosine-specific restriction endonuclease McrA
VLRAATRHAILRKTDGRCHICGGTVVSRWQADHVLAHAGGASHSVENYLAAHALCSNYRWDYDPEEFQWVLKIGVWARLQMEKGGQLGDSMLSAFSAYEKHRQGRRRS